MRKEVDENILLLSSRFLKQKQYWLDKLSGNIERTELVFPGKKSPPSLEAHERIKILLPVHLSQQLIKLSKQSDLSLYIILLAGIKLLIHRYMNHNNEDIIVISPLHRLKISEETINNHVFIRDGVNGEMTFKELILDVRASALGAYGNQDYPFDRLVDHLFHTLPRQERSISDIAGSLKNIHDVKNIEELNAKLSFSFLREEESILGTIIYDSTGYEKYYMQRLAEHFINLLDNGVQDVDMKISNISVLSKKEKKQLLLDFNDTWERYPQEKTIHQLFEEQVENRGDNPGVIFNKEQLSYREVNKKANRLARELRAKGVKQDTMVGIIVGRSLEMVVGILGILKSGGAYLPIDPDYPQERIEYILDDCNAELVLLQSQLSKNEFFKFSTENILLNVASMNSGKDKDRNIENINKSNDLAYVMHTSGSTGRPKGVMVEHRNVTRLVKSSNVVELTEETRILQTGVPVFDAATFEMWGSLLNGGILYLAGNDVILDAKGLGRVLAGEHITVLWLSSPLFNQLTRRDSHIFENLKYLIVGGDVLSPKYINMVRNTDKELVIVNGYGPTENTTFSTFYPIDRDFKKNIPIGKPIRNSTAYVLDKERFLQPIGLLGELCVGGDGISRGYLNSSELTKDKFTKNPYVKGDRLYKTGDLVRWLPDGNLEFSGRMDHQVKIRGFRVEPGEIENQLQKHEGIKDAVVTVTGMSKEGSRSAEKVDYENKSLCAYIAFKDEETLSVPELRQYLSMELPDYMIPSYFVVVEEFALTANGKIDRKKLPDPAKAALGSGGEYRAPTNALELRMVEICNEVLGRSITGIDDNFFEIGGDSIRAIQIASRMHQAGYKIEVADIFQYPTISELAQKVKKIEKTAVQEPIIGVVPLAPNQHAFFAQSRIEPHHFNQAVLLYSREEIDPEAVKAVFTKIQEHHDALRMVFGEKDGVRVQGNEGLNHPLSLQVYDFREQEQEKAVETMEKEINALHAGFDLEKSPLMKLGLFHLDDGDRLLIAIHHLVTDAFSWRILLEDLENLYRQYEGDGKLVLPLKTDSFKVWSEKLGEYANSSSFLEEKTHLLELESIDFPAIRKDFREKDNYLRDVETLSFRLGKEQTKLLFTGVNSAFGTEIKDVLLTALGLAVKKLFSSNQVLIALEGDGRQEFLEVVDTRRTVGWFTTVYPVLLDFSYENDMARQVIEIKETLGQVPHKGIGYGILKYLTAKDHKNKNKKEIDFKLNPQISFKYWETFDLEDEQKSLFFEIARESAGNLVSQKEQREYELEVSAVGDIKTEQMEISISYNRKQYKSKTIKKLLNRYETLLCDVISFCSSRETNELTPSDLTYKKLAVEELEELKKQYFIEDIYGLTPLQEGMVFHAIYQTDASTDFVQISYRLQGELDLEQFEKSLNELFKRHDVLRTAFVYEGLKRPLQVVLKDRRPAFYKDDIRFMDSEDEKERYVKEFTEKDRRNSFDLSKDVLMRVTVIRVDDESYEVTWSFHHISIDGWCTGIIIGEFFELYNSFRENRAPRLAPVQPYRTYIQWLEARDKEKSKGYWEKCLEHYEEKASIPKIKSLKNHEDEVEYLNELVTFEFDERKTKGLNKLAAKNHVTLNSAFRAIWGIMLGRYSGRYNTNTDVVYGAVVSGRPSELAGVERMVGLFINTIPVRIRFEEKETLTQLLQRVQKDALESEPHHYYPLVKIQAESTLKQHLLDHILAFENYPIGDQIGGLVETSKNEEPEFTASDFSEFGQTNYDFNISVGPGQQIRISFSYNGNVYQKSMVERISRHFKNLVDQMIDSTGEELKIEEINLLSVEEQKELLFDFNASANKYPEDKTLDALFEEEAEKSPNSTAVVAQSLEEERHVITYRQLNERANRLSRQLRSEGVQTDTIIGIIAARSVEMIIGILGILKSGGAYLPIDPGYPKERIDYMLADSGAKVLVNEVSKVNRNIPPTPPTPPTQLCYVIYTSGTTGRPKGVPVDHRSIVNTLTCRKEEYKMCREDIALQLFSYAFDGFLTSFFTPLISGARVVLLSEEEVKDVDKIKEVIIKERITHFISVPALYLTILENLSEDEASGLKTITLAGDRVSPTIPELTKQKNKDIEIAHEYGVTEASVMSTIYRHQEAIDWITIGNPVWNTRVCIMNEHQGLQPVGVAGELCISGTGLARGYLNNPELTAEKFLDNPLTGLLYRTGDLARWLPDDNDNRNIEFLGRMDDQVKLRGYRIELGEIENQLLTHDKIIEAVVVDREDKGDKYLCAYLAAGSPEPGAWSGLDIKEIREYLTLTLPDYMIPTYFIPMEKLPLTPNGKIDRKALPVPEAKAGEAHTAPRNEIEKKMAEIWAEVLGTEKDTIGIDDHFSRLGGHSLKATTMVSRLQREFNVHLPLVELFKKPSIRQLGEYIETAEKESLSLQESNLALLKKEPGKEKHLFFIHDGTGEVQGYTNFSNRLDIAFNCWGLRAGRLKNHTPLNLSIKDMAKNYIETIKTVQPPGHGPYYIAGWSVGGVIAFEMVKQLEKENEEIAFLGMIDPAAPSLWKWMRTWKFSLRSEWKLARLFFMDDVKLHEKLKKIKKIDQFWPEILDHLEAGHFDLKSFKRMLKGFGMKALPNLHQWNLRDIIYYLNIGRTLNNTMANYIPLGKIHTPVHYFKAKQSWGMKEKRWQKYTTAGVKFSEIAGDHFSIFKTPNVKDFAEIFAAAVNEKPVRR